MESLSEEDHDVLPVIAEVFQDIPSIRRYCEGLGYVGSEYEAPEDPSLAEIRDEREGQLEDICRVENELMRIHAEALTERAKAKDLRFTRTSFFKDLSAYAAREFNLIQRNDLFPDKIRQYLDFTFNPTLHTCRQPCPPLRTEVKPAIRSKPTKCPGKIVPLISFPPMLVPDPEEIVFKNYTINKTYKQKLKLHNNSRYSLLLMCYDFPPDSPFRLNSSTEFSRIAPGMCLEFLIIFKPTTYKEYQESVLFKTHMGGGTVILVSCIREPPKLLCYIFNPFLPAEVKLPEPGSRYFSERRRDALNSTIDCGTCLLGTYNLVTIVVKNVGQKGKFFIATENEWYFNELNETKMRSMQLTQGCFTIFPAYFEIDHEEVGELFVYFCPNQAEMFTEKIFIICDNNSFIEMELLGDAILYCNSFVKVKLTFDENTFSYIFRLATITLPPYEPAELAFLVFNKSPVFFEYYWSIEPNDTEPREKKAMPVDWIKIMNPTRCLPSFSATEIFVKLTPETEEEGVYSCFIRFMHLKNVPTLSKPPDETLMKLKKEFVEEIPDEEDDGDMLDVLISQLEVLCVVKKCQPIEEIKPKVVPSTNVLRKNRLKLSLQYLNFGILPIGVRAWRSFSIENLSKGTIEWKLLEIRWSKNINLELIRNGNSLSRTCGILQRGEKRKITYSVQTQLRGDESEKIKVKFQPQSGIVLPGATVEVKVELLVLENGLFEHLYAPCFTGDLEKMISLRIMCHVASIIVLFYLPEQNKGYRKYLWPPKEYSQLTTEYNLQQCYEEWTPPDEVIKVEGEDVPEPVLARLEIDESLLDLIDYDSIAATYPTVKVKSVPVKKPIKLTFCMENITPVHGKFTVNPTNYSPVEDCLNHVLVRAKSRPPEYFWDKACQLNSYGIVIEPVINSGEIVPYEIVEIELWIYANTWGKYLEEVMVEIDDLTPFCFNLIIEVVGSPIEFPFARNTILKYPTIRFNHVDGSSARSFTVTNVSTVPLRLSWYVFSPDESSTVPFNIILEVDEERVKLDLSREYYGTIACAGCVELTPLDFTLEKQSTATVTLTINPCDFGYSCTNLRYDLICFVYLNEESKFKANYFRRKCGVDLMPAKIEAIVTVETPKLEVDVSSDETVIDLFVNDLLLRRTKDPEIYLLLRNVDTSRLELKLEVDVPFYISQVRIVPTGVTDQQNLVLHRQECVQVLLTCRVTVEELMMFAEFIYKIKQGNRAEDFMAVICKDLRICTEGMPRQIIPFELRLHYPRIVVKPNYIKFGQCLLYNTRKTLLSVYNLSGAPVSFEIYKSSKRNDFETNPFHAEIPGTTGVNKQFVDVAVYFTPKDCSLYIENLRIVTNIPYYYVDVPVTGHGTNNEKFHVD